MTRTRRIASTALLLVMLALSGCSSSSDDDHPARDLQPVTLQLSGATGGEFAGYYAALAEGFYEDAGLAVTIEELTPETSPIDALTSGVADYAIASVPVGLTSVGAGASITHIAQIFQRSGNVQVSPASAGIAHVADLRGKDVGDWAGTGQDWELWAALGSEGITADDVTLVRQRPEQGLAGFLAGAITSAQATTYDGLAQILGATNPEDGNLYQPADLSILDWNDLGFAMLQDAVWAPAGSLADPAFADQTQRFLEATFRGWAFARDHVDEVASTLSAAGSPAGRTALGWSVNEANKLVWPAPDGIGAPDTDVWDKTVSLLTSAVSFTGRPGLSAAPAGTVRDGSFTTAALKALRDDDVDVTGESFEPIKLVLNPGGE